MSQAGMKSVKKRENLSKFDLFKPSLPALCFFQFNDLWRNFVNLHDLNVDFVTTYLNSRTGTSNIQ